MTSQEELKSFAATFQSALAQVDEAGSTSRDQETPRTEAARKTTARYRAVSPPEAEAKVVSQTPRTEYGLLTKLGHTFLGKSWEVRKTELQQYVINKGSTDWDKVAYWKKYIEDSANNTNGRGRINLRNLERDIDKSFGY